jgi:hypothetical protein
MIACTIQKQFKNFDRLKIKKGSAMELAIISGKYPAGGMAEVQASVKNHICELTRLTQSFDKDTLMEHFKVTYEHFVEVLVTGFYAFMIQGRIGAILALRVTRLCFLINLTSIILLIRYNSSNYSCENYLN